MQQIVCTIGFAVICMFTAQAQAIRVAYFGETVTHYGVKVAYESPIYRYQKKASSTQKSFLFTPGLAVYRHPANHVGVILSPEFAYRRLGRRGGTFELAISPSYFRYFLEGQTFEVGENGRFERVPLAGRHAFLPTVSIGWGKDLSVRRQIPLAWYARLNVMQQRPYNASSLLRFGIELGIIKPLKKS